MLDEKTTTAELMENLLNKEGNDQDDVQDSILLLAPDQEQHHEHDLNSSNHLDANNEVQSTLDSWERGEKQPIAFRDWPFAILFLLQFLTVFSVGIAFVKPEHLDLIHFVSFDGHILYNILFVIILSIIYTTFALILLKKWGKQLISLSIWSSVAVATILSILFSLMGLWYMTLPFALSAFFGTLYAMSVTNRIPFAAANLHAAVQVLNTNKGVWFVHLLMIIVGITWSLFWLIGLIGVLEVQVDCSDDSSCSMDWNHDKNWIFLPFILSLFFTQQVLSNFGRTVCSGITASWYFDPQTTGGWCSKAVHDSLKRSLTTTLGSICFGSLLVAAVQFLRFVVNMLRQQREEDHRSRRNDGGTSFLLCCLDCMMGIVEDVIQYFNKWAFIYVGVYGYNYTKAGKKVMTLFQARGWSIIINDGIIQSVLNFISLSIVGLTVLSSLAFGIDLNLVWAALIFPITVTSFLDSIVSTVLVCFAEAPFELEENHPIHNREIKEGCEHAYPLLRF
jgi:hypothetical protein